MIFQTSLCESRYAASWEKQMFFMNACVSKSAYSNIIDEALTRHCNDESAPARAERLCSSEQYETSSSPRREQLGSSKTDFKPFSQAFNNHRCCAPDCAGSPPTAEIHAPPSSWWAAAPKRQGLASPLRLLVPHQQIRFAEWAALRNLGMWKVRRKNAPHRLSHADRQALQLALLSAFPPATSIGFQSTPARRCVCCSPCRSAAACKLRWIHGCCHGLYTEKKLLRWHCRCGELFFSVGCPCQRLRIQLHLWAQSNWRTRKGRGGGSAFTVTYKRHLLKGENGTAAGKKELSYVAKS